MDNYKHDMMLTLRVPTALRDRLKKIAARDDRTVSQVAKRAMEVGLEIIEAREVPPASGLYVESPLELAVLAILKAHGILSAAQDETNTRPDVEFDGTKIIAKSGKKRRTIKLKDSE
ncbi:MAG TPA: hypothetical protein VKB12_15955 [Pyrinomonadaceae bacterium]|nr:hypothetical protein [Pyrinomonadaceae bacterium]